MVPVYVSRSARWAAAGNAVSVTASTAKIKFFQLPMYSCPLIQEMFSALEFSAGYYHHLKPLDTNTTAPANACRPVRIAS
jgi:hypothetical protein